MSTSRKQLELVEKLRVGDKSAFKPLWLSLRPMFVFHIFTKIPANLREDFESELMERLWRASARFDIARGVAVSTWAFTVARNLAGSFMRRKWLADDFIPRAVDQNGDPISMDTIPAPSDLGDPDLDERLDHIEECLRQKHNGEMLGTVFRLLVDTASVKDIAVLLGYSRYWIYQLIERDIIPEIRKEFSWTRSCAT